MSVDLRGLTTRLRTSACAALVCLLTGCIVIERVPPEAEVPPEAMAGAGAEAGASTAGPSSPTQPGSGPSSPTQPGSGPSSVAGISSAPPPSTAPDAPLKPVSPWSSELTQEEMRAPAAAEPPPAPAAMESTGMTGSFGAGAELERRAETPLGTADNTAPSFGQGAELYRAEPGEQLPPPPQTRALPLRPGLSEQAGQVPPSSATEQLARTLAADVEDLRELTLSRRILPRTLIRIDAVSSRGRELRLLTVGDPRLEPLTLAIEGHFNVLQISARQHDRVGMMASINSLSTRLRELQALLAARP